MEIKIDITKDKAKDQYYEMQNEKSTIAIIYTNESSIKSKINIIIYDIIINEVRYQYLEKDIYYNIFMMKMMIL